MNARRIGAAVALVGATAAIVAGYGASASSARSTNAAATKSKAFVVLVTDVNQLNDHGFNQLAYQGLLRAERKLGITGAVYQSPSAAAYIPNLAQAARKGADLVVSVGFDQANAVAKVAKQFPKTHFAIIDVDQTTLAGKPKNVEGLIFKEQEVGLSRRLSRRSPREAEGRAARRSARSAARSSRPSTATSRATRRERRRPTRASSC